VAVWAEEANSEAEEDRGELQETARPEAGVLEEGVEECAEASAAVAEAVARWVRGSHGPRSLNSLSLIRTSNTPIQYRRRRKNHPL